MSDDLKIDSPFDFSLVIERMIREKKTKLPLQALQKLEEFANICFEEGFKAGKKPVNHPKFKSVTA